MIDPWKPVRDLCFVRELPVEQMGLIISPIDLNRSAEHSPVLYGMVEAVGPRVTDVQVGDRVAFEIGSGEYRIPGDEEVRIMYERDIAAVEVDGLWIDGLPDLTEMPAETVEQHWKTDYRGRQTYEPY